MAGIKFELSSIFKGEGFQKAKHELKNVGGESKKATGALGQLGGALGNVGGDAGKAAGAIGGLVQGFASMGIAGGVIAAGTLAIEGMFKWLNRANDKAKELAEAFKNNLANAAKTVATHVANLAKQYSALMSSLNRGAKNRGVVESGDIARMGLAKDQALIGKSGEDAAKTEYEWTRKIEAEKTKAAKEELNDTQKRIALEQKHLAELKKSLADKQQLFAAQNARALEIGNSDADINTKTEAYDSAQVTKKKVIGYQAEIAKVEEELKKLADEKLKAEQALQTQTLGEKVRVQQAEQKIADERKKAEEKAAEDKKKAAEKEAADAKKKAEEKAKQDKEELEARAKAAKKALDEEYAGRKASADATLKAAKDVADRWEAEHANAKGKSFQAFDKETREAAREEAKQKRKSDAARAINDARYARLDKAMQRGGRGLSKADKEWYEKYKHWMDAQGKNPHQKNLEDAQMRALAEQRRTAKTLEDIRDELKGQLGL